jgi:4'-phosphopantetheinyl transferase
VSAVAEQAVDVALWPLELDQPRGELAALRGLLSADELRRAGRYRFSRDASRFVAGRGQLRRILGGLAGLEPASLRVVEGPYGKPALLDDPELEFNLAHADGVGLLATGRGGALGVDVELPRPGFGTDDIARQFFCPEELSELLALGEAEREAAFLRCWTRKEAFVKALGDGLQVPLDAFAVTLGPDVPAELRWCMIEREAGRWEILDVSHVCPAATAALCVEVR